MAIDFHSENNRLTYTRRSAGDDWARAVRSLVAPEGARVVDIGCGGGVYCAAWLDLGASSVTGVDFSAVMLSAARERCGHRQGLTFQMGEAHATGLPGGRADIVFARALVHHLDGREGLTAFAAEARRLLAPGGTLVVQDRTIEDVTRPGSPTHLRGWFFEKFPSLLDVERARRPSTGDVLAAVRAAGLGSPRTLPLSEARREYRNADEVRDDLLARTGRSILHELGDAQLAELADHIGRRLAGATGIREVDHWTLWAAPR